MTSSDTRTGPIDVAIVGGGPAGRSAGVFTTRYGLETVVFDRGRSSLGRCAHLENYLGFPAGIDVGTFYDLMYDHAREAGCEVVPEMVTGVRRESGSFDVETDGGCSVRAERVLAATKHGAAYLDSLGNDSLVRSEGDERRFQDAVVDRDGRTPVDGLYVAGPLAGVGDQTVIAAGHGATVARSLITDARRGAGYWAEIEEPYDWVRRDAALDEEWRRRDRWDEWFDSHDEPEALATDELEAIRDAYIDETLGMYIADTEIARKKERGQRRVAEHLDDRIQLETIPDDRIIDYVATCASNAARGTSDE